MNSRLPLWLAALAVAFAPAVAQADKLDLRLNKEMVEIKKHLDEKGYKNVGVLRFAVQKGKNTPKFDNAPYNGNLATRVENLLIIHNGSDEAKAIGVTREAGLAAAKAKVGDWPTDENERKKLFGVSYPLAWGKKSVKVDAFLTGLVQVSADRKKTTYSITCFDKNDPKPTVIKKFTLDTDRDIVRDLGFSYVLSPKARASLVTRRDEKSSTESAIDSIDPTSGGDDVRPAKDKDKDKDDDTGKGGTLDVPKDKPKSGSATNPHDVAGLDIIVLVNGKEVDLNQAKNEGPPWELVSPAPGQKIAFRFKNTTDKRLGIVFKVNGFSTFDNAKESAENCRKWVISAKKSILIEGFYAPDGKKFSLDPFKILVGDEAAQMKERFGEKAGLLEIDVFAEGAAVPRGEDDKLEISAKGMPPSKEKQARETYKSLRTALLKSAKLKADTNVTKREIFVPDEGARRDIEVGVTDFEGYSVAHLGIKVVPGKGE